MNDWEYVYVFQSLKEEMSWVGDTDSVQKGHPARNIFLQIGIWNVGVCWCILKKFRAEEVVAGLFCCKSKVL